MQVLVIGPAFLDVVAAPVGRLPGPGEELRTDAVALAPGGFAIAATALCRLGVEAALASPIGDDSAGRFLALSLEAEGVPLVRSGSKRTPVTIALNLRGDRGFLTAGFPTDEELLLAGRSALESHPDCEAVHLSCRGPFAEDLARMARAEGRFVSMDCGTDPAWLRSASLRRVLSLADLYLPSAREAVLVTGRDGVRDAAAALLDVVPRALVKLGPEGVLSVGPNGVEIHPTTPREAIDATGAGDVFDAGYLAGRVHGLGEAGAIRLGQYAAGCAVGALGGASAAPTLAAARTALPDLCWSGT